MLYLHTVDTLHTSDTAGNADTNNTRSSSTVCL